MYLCRKLSPKTQSPGVHDEDELVNILVYYFVRFPYTDFMNREKNVTGANESFFFQSFYQSYKRLVLLICLTFMPINISEKKIAVETY